MIISLECRGIGAKKFLQGQLTCDISALRQHTSQFTACCNIQGRVIFTLYIIMNNETSFSLLIPISMKHIALEHLEKYARFSQCTLTENHQRIDISENNKIDAILRGIPTIYPETSQRFVPQRLNLHKIPHAMSFKKGCYLGQEIIARLHFKGTLKHHLFTGELSTETTLVIGEPIKTIEGEDTGCVIDYCHYHGKVALTFVNQSDNTAPCVDHHLIQKIKLPAYL